MSIANEYGSSTGGTGPDPQGGSTSPQGYASTQAEQGACETGGSVVDQSKAKAQEYLEQGKAKAQEYLDQGKTMAQDYYEQSRDAAQDYYHQGRAKAKELEQSVEQYIREKPIQSVLIAAGVGVVLGALMKR